MEKILKTGYKVKRNVKREISLSPQINLSGDWLQSAGFEVGESIQVYVSQNQIIIKRI